MYYHKKGGCIFNSDGINCTSESLLAVPLMNFIHYVHLYVCMSV